MESATINEPVDLVEPATAEWQVTADPEAITALFEELNELQTTSSTSATTSTTSTSATSASSTFAGVTGTQSKVAPPAVRLEISEISRDGDINIKSNQPLKVPKFSDGSNTSATQGRQLVALSEVDVSRDVVDF